jgi:hypothetical protein
LFHIAAVRGFSREEGGCGVLHFKAESGCSGYVLAAAFGLRMKVVRTKIEEAIR